VTLEQARTELNTLIADLVNAYPGDAAVLGNVSAGVGLHSVAVGLKEATVGAIASGLWVLLAAMGLLLLVASANIANLFIVRADARQREVAVRRALGAAFGDVAGLFLAESMLLATAALIGGLWLAAGALRLLVTYGPTTLPRLQEVRLDPASVAYTIVLAVGAGVVFGGMPISRLPRLLDSLRESGRGQTITRHRHRLRQMLMAGQVAVALVLLVAAGLLLQSFARLRAIDVGFNASSALTFRVGLPSHDYPSRDVAVVAHRAMLDRLGQQPGVTAVSASTGLPLADACFGNALLVRGRTLAGSGTQPWGRICAVSEGYVRAMGLRLVAGRDLERADIDRSRPNVLVNQAFVSTILDNGDPFGVQIRSNAPPPPGTRIVDRVYEWSGAPPWLTIVGVVSNTPFRTLAETNVPMVYMPMSLAGGPDIPSIAMLGPSISAMTYVVRSDAPAATLTTAIYRTVAGIDRTLAVAQVRPLQQVVDRASSQAAFTMALLLLAAGVALLMGVVGIYGVVAYVVSQRRSEIGLRLALGASPRGVVGMVVRQGAAVTLAGVLIGLGIAVAGSGALTSLLYDVSPRDPFVFVAVSGLLVLIAMIACWLPARRAAAISPTEALRAD
jgi:predicted permease